jgi:hypothetical protein
MIYVLCLQLHQRVLENFDNKNPSVIDISHRLDGLNGIETWTVKHLLKMLQADKGYNTEVDIKKCDRTKTEVAIFRRKGM